MGSYRIYQLKRRRTLSSGIPAPTFAQTAQSANSLLLPAHGQGAAGQQGPITHNPLPGYSIANLPIHAPGRAEGEVPKYNAGSITRQQERESNKGYTSQGEAETTSTLDDQKGNTTGLPDTLKAGIESLSGYSLDDIHVHYHSSKPVEVEALAYTQGSEIHVGPGQEQHLPHEAWHIVQQKQGRVRATLQTKGVAINDDEDLEREAEVMGVKAIGGPSEAGLSDQLDVPSTLDRSLASSNESIGRTPHGVMQRIAKAKGNISQPDASLASAVVPDLPQTRVAQIQGANDKTSRQTVLTELLDFLDAQGVVDDRARTDVVYDDQQHPTSNAVTQAVGTGDNDPVRITVYKNAFDSGPAVLYSTLRHELIHAGQRQLVPDDTQAEATDDYMHDDLLDQAPGNGTLYTKDDLELPLQEIETHTWELLHASQTGVNTNQDYMDSTVNDLVRYAVTLIHTVYNDQKLLDDAFAYWRNYLDKAVAMLGEADSNYPQYTNIGKMARDLQKAIYDRDPSPKKKKKKI